MEHITIALVSEDQEYAKALGMGLLHVCRTFLIRLFTPQEFQARDDGEDFDLLVWDGELQEENAEPAQGVIKLVEKPSQVRKEFNKKDFQLYRYRCAQSFVADLFEIYGQLTGRHPVNVARQDVRRLP